MRAVRRSLCPAVRPGAERRCATAATQAQAGWECVTGRFVVTSRQRGCRARSRGGAVPTPSRRSPVLPRSAAAAYSKGGRPQAAGHAAVLSWPPPRLAHPMNRPSSSTTGRRWIFLASMMAAASPVAVLGRTTMGGDDMCCPTVSLMLTPCVQPERAAACGSLRSTPAGSLGVPARRQTAALSPLPRSSIRGDQVLLGRCPYRHALRILRCSCPSSKGPEVRQGMRPTAPNKDGNRPKVPKSCAFRGRCGASTHLLAQAVDVSDGDDADNHVALVHHSQASHFVQLGGGRRQRLLRRGASQRARGHEVRHCSCQAGTRKLVAAPGVAGGGGSGGGGGTRAKPCPPRLPPGAPIPKSKSFCTSDALTLSDS